MTLIVGKFAAAAIIAYLLGAIPSALIVSKRMAGIDITQYGSGNIGSTNALRTLGRKAGIIVIILDLCKAIAAVMLAKLIIGDSMLPIAGIPFLLNQQVGEVMAALMVMVGHNWSVFAKFRGGKGVAAYYGSWLAIWPVAALFGGLILILITLRTKYMSLGSILGALSIWCLLALLTVFSRFSPIYLVYALVAAALIVYQHRENINRLQTGTELKFGDGSHKLDL